MKTLEQLEQEAKQARENLIATIERDASPALLADDMIIAAVAMVTYQFALGAQEASCSGSGKALPEASQEELDSDGWIEWNGGQCPVDGECHIDVKFRGGMTLINDLAGRLRWWHAKGSRRHDGEPDLDIIAYRISK